MKILDELYDGNISASDRPLSYYAELDEISRLMKRHREKLLAGMTDEQKQHYLQIERYFGEQKKIDDRYSFLAGFRLGVQMMAESLGEEKYTATAFTFAGTKLSEAPPDSEQP